MGAATAGDASRTHFVRAYTWVLLGAALLAAVAGVVESFIIPRLETSGDTLVANLVRLDQILAFLLAPAAGLTVIARRRGLAWARRMTTFTSIFLALVVPIGTLVFIYWLWRVRPREAASAH